MMTLKEKQMLLKMKTALGEPVDELRAEIDMMVEAEAQREAQAEQQQQAIVEERKSAFNSIFANLASDLNKLAKEDKKRTAEQQNMVNQLGQLFEAIATDPEVPQEIRDDLVSVDEEVVSDPEVIEEAPAKPLTLVERAASRVKKAPSMFVQPDPVPTSKDLQAIQSKLKLLEGWVGKISMAGPGGGEVLFRYLDDVNRSTMNAGNDNWVLEYDATSKKVQFTEDVGPIRTLKINTAGQTIPSVPGMLSWNINEDCLDIHHADGSTLQTGLEHYIRVYNNTGSLLTNGTVVRFSGVHVVDDTNEPTVVPHIANNSVHGLYTVGVLTNDVPANTYGRATWIGKVHDLNTTGSDVGETWVEGDLLYVSPTNPGKMTKVKPYAPNIVVNVAAVLRVGTTNGEILVRPTIYPRLYYGSFSDTTNQTAVAINTPYAVKYSTTDISSGHRIANNTQIVAEVSGCYNYQFSLQIASNSASKKQIYIWARKNGVDVPRSATQITVTGNGEYRAPAWNFVMPMAANDYFELMWATSDVGAFIASPAATAFCPAIPSVILTVTQAAL